MKILLPVLVLLLPLHADSPHELPTTSPSTVATQTAKLKAITLTLDFKNASIDEAVMFLRVESKRFDPEHAGGFNFVISSDAAALAKPVTMELNKVTFEQALQSVCELAGVEYVVEASVIRILAVSEKAPDAVTEPVVQPGDKAAEDTMRKLKGIFIDRVNFDKLDVAMVIRFLGAKSREMDPEHTGVNFVLSGITENDNIKRSVSLSLDQISLADLIREIEAQTNLHASVSDNMVTFKP